MARKGNPISVRLGLNRSSDSNRFSEGDRESYRMVHLYFWYVWIVLSLVRRLPFPLQILAYLMKKTLILLYLKLIMLLLMEGGGGLYDIVAPFLSGGGLGDPGVQPPTPSDTTMVPLITEDQLRHEGESSPNPLSETLLSEEERRMELHERMNYLVERDIEPTYDPKLLDAQLELEVKLEGALRAEGYNAQSIFACRNQWRRIAFSPDSRPQFIKTRAIKKTLYKYSADIRQSMCFRRISKAIEKEEIRLYKD